MAPVECVYRSSPLLKMLVTELDGFCHLQDQTRSSIFMLSWQQWAYQLLNCQTMNTSGQQIYLVQVPFPLLRHGIFSGLEGIFNPGSLLSGLRELFLNTHSTCGSLISTDCQLESVWLSGESRFKAHCCLCSMEPETRDHLFISFPFAAELWNQVFIRVGGPQQYFQVWEDLVQWSVTAQSRSIKLLRLLASQAVVYSIWRQRNNAVHNQTTIAPPVIFREIDKTIRNTIHARKCRRRFHNLMGKWLIWFQISLKSLLVIIDFLVFTFFAKKSNV